MNKKTNIHRKDWEKNIKLVSTIEKNISFILHKLVTGHLKIIINKSCNYRNRWYYPSLHMFITQTNFSVSCTCKVTDAVLIEKKSRIKWSFLPYLSPTPCSSMRSKSDCLHGESLSLQIAWSSFLSKYVTESQNF